MRSSSGRKGLAGSCVPRTGPRASIAGFQRTDQLRREDAPSRMHSLMGPGASCELQTLLQASCICCFQAEDALDPVTRTDN